ncbi:hypothetical protein HYDPIDRAFT_113768 [Hydnomerulius pinastri MD-312]|uniref:Uncharacterized protein n=1 Tax=Hydnomerulius pinastri MD-312 TaxID=994086 RepID=A0A0C9VY31_9AGAM|nr:hypothetical protein HYDPIDRAFT_113768 [Hydnomerulius pinastri MD-312]
MRRTSPTTTASNITQKPSTQSSGQVTPEARQMPASDSGPEFLIPVSSSSSESSACSSDPPQSTGVTSSNHANPPKALSADMCMIQRNTITLQVCGHVYDNSPCPSFLDTSELFYESRASYENPLITATSRSIISDIHALMRHFCIVDVPKPLSVLHNFLWSRPPANRGEEPWFRALRIWTEVDDISETESFDGHRKSMVEHTLNILLFPGLHTTYKIPKTLSLHHPPSPSESGSHLSLALPATPSLPIPGTPLALPSPLHLQLPIMTRLSFNEQGQITYHRDIWDVRDVLRLVPGIRLVQWFAGRASASGLGWISRKLREQSSIEGVKQNGDSGQIKSDGALLTAADSSV